MNHIKGIKSVLAQANKILHKILNIYIPTHLIEGSSKKIESLFPYIIQKHSLFLFLMYAANLRFLRYVLHFFEERLASFFAFMP